MVGDQNSTNSQCLVRDSIDEIDGLERIFAICVGLDAVESEADAISKVRSRLYRGNTRAQLALLIVNEALAGGFLEFLGLVRSCEPDFDQAAAKRLLNGNALDNILPDYDAIRAQILQKLPSQWDDALRLSIDLPSEELVVLVPNLMKSLHQKNGKVVGTVVRRLSQLPIASLTEMLPMLVPKVLINTLTGTRITGFAQFSHIFNFYLAGLLHRP